MKNPKMKRNKEIKAIAMRAASKILIEHDYSEIKVRLSEEEAEIFKNEISKMSKAFERKGIEIEASLLPF